MNLQCTTGRGFHRGQDETALWLLLAFHKTFTFARVAGIVGMVLLGGIQSQAASLPVFSLKQISPPRGVVNLQLCAAMDLNSDGYPEVLVSQLASGQPTFPIIQVPLLAFGNDRGTLIDGASSLQPPVFTGHTRDIRVADFNGDGRDDVLLADFGTDGPPFPGGQSQVLMQTPEGTLRDETATRLPGLMAATHHAAVGDVDGDGDVDIYLCNIWNRDSAGPLIYLNDGRGFFNPSTNALPREVSSLQNRYTSSLFVDVDLDGDLDLVLGGHAGTEERDRILLNDGRGHFAYAPINALPPRLAGLKGDTLNIVSADFDHDGWPDLAMAMELDYNRPFLQVLFNNRDGTFRDAGEGMPQPMGGPWIPFVRVADLNGDGWDDLVFNFLGAGVKIYLNDEGKRFVDVTSNYSFPGSVATVEVADFDGDGNPDIYIQTLSGAFFVAQNMAPPRAAGFLPGRRNQAIVFPLPGSRTFGEEPFSLNATASSGLSPEYEIISGPASMSGNQLRLTGVGEVVIRATQPGNGSFNSAAPIIRKFRVMDGTPVILTQPDSLNAATAESAVLSVTVQSRLPIQFQWFKDGQPIAGATSSALVLKNVSPEDAGKYHVVASSAGGSVSSAAAVLSVTRARQVIRFPAIPDLMAGGAPFKLTAESSSGLAVSYKVLAGSASIDGNNLTVFGSGRVIVRAEQAGNASFLPADPVDVSFVASGAAPGFKEQPRSAVARNGERVEFSAGIAGGGGYTFQWKKNGLPIPGASGSTFAIENVHQSDEGGYSLAVQNPAGSALSDIAFLKVLPVPAYFDFRQSGLQGWTLIRHSLPLESTAQGIRLQINGVDPSMNGPARNYPTGTPLLFELRIRSEAGGTAQLFYFRNSASEADSIHFEVVAGEWKEYKIPLPSLGSSYRLRFDPPGSSGECLIAWMRVSAVDTEEGKEFPSVRWDDPAPLTYGQGLGDSQLHAVGEPLGKIEFAPGPGTILPAGFHSLSAVYVPADPLRSRNVTAQTTVEVRKAKPEVTWISPAAVVYGTALSPIQLNAFSSVPGQLFYTPAAGTVLEAGDHQRLEVVFKPADSANFSETRAESFLDVRKAAQTISFSAPGDVVAGDPPVLLRANASSGLPVRLVLVSGPATLAGDQLAISGEGQIVVQAEQEGSPNFLPAPPVVHIVRVRARTGPLVTPIMDVAVDEGARLVVTPLASSPDRGTGPLVFKFGAAVPEGMSIDVSNGVVTWVPGEGQGPGVYPVSIVVSDGRIPPLTAEVGFKVSVRELNSSPEFVDPPARLIKEGASLSYTFKVRDADLPANRLKYSLQGVVQNGVSINPATGELTWNSDSLPGLQEFPLRVAVTDDGEPPLEAVHEVKLVSNVPPLRITLQPASQVVQERDPVELEVRAEGVGPLSYQWRLNGFDLAGETNSHLKLGSVRTSDAGSYTVRVADRNMSVQSSLATLLVRAIVADFDFTQGNLLGWTTLRHVAPLTADAAGLKLSITGNDPSLNGPTRNYPSTTPLWFEARLRSDSGGVAQLFYFKASASASEANSVVVNVPAGSLRTVRVAVPPLGSGYRLRFDPPGISGGCVVEYLRLIERDPDSGKSFSSITWPNPAPVRVGDLLGPLQLNATSDTPGTFSFDPPAGARLPEGNHSLLAEFKPSDGSVFRTITARVTLQVLPAEMPASVGPLTGAMISESGLLVFTFSTQPGQRYGLETSTDLQDWRMIDTITGLGGKQDVRTVFRAEAGSGFFRVRLSPGPP